MNVTLETLANGQRATIAGLDGAGALRHRLMELGFVDGADVEIISRGTPALVRLRTGRVTLSWELARSIRVTPLDTPTVSAAGAR